MALITLDDDYRPMYAVGSSEDEEAAVNAAISAVDAWLKRQIGRDLESTTYTSKRMSGDGTYILRPPQWPITAVASLTVDTIAWDVLLYSDTTDSEEEAFLPEHGSWIEARYDPFTAGSGNILITYTAGYTTIPGDLKMAAILMTWLLLLERDRAGDGARNVGPETVQEIKRNSRDYEFIDRTIKAFRFRP